MSDADDADEKGRPRKAPTAFRTISEVADDLNIPQHVLRFWESKFPQLKPLKRGGGRRYYRPEDIALLKRVGDFSIIRATPSRACSACCATAPMKGRGPLRWNCPWAIRHPPPRLQKLWL